MYSLEESCKMNGMDFGDYIEYVMERMVAGEKDARSLLTNHVNISPRRGVPLIVNPRFQSVGKRNPRKIFLQPTLNRLKITITVR